MKKSLIGALIGGIIIFLWQFLSWTVLNLHLPAQQYTDKQDVIMSTLNNNLEEGGYYIPNLPAGAGWDEQQRAMTEAAGKPWATIQYHKALEDSMTMNMVRGLMVNIVIILLACWIFTKINKPTFSTIFIASLFIGFIVFLNSAYTMHIWYQTFDLIAHFIDSIASWGLAGLWLGWWLTKNKTVTEKYNRGISNVERLNV